MIDKEQLDAIIKSTLALWKGGEIRDVVVKKVTEQHGCPDLLVKMVIFSFTGQRYLKRVPS